MENCDTSNGPAFFRQLIRFGQRPQPGKMRTATGTPPASRQFYLLYSPFLKWIPDKGLGASRLSIQSVAGFMVETADNDAAFSPVEALFKKNQLAAEGPTAALEYRERQKATLENMKRLRALRLAMPTGAKKHSRRSSRT